MSANPLPILYSFRRCPYAMRARLAIAVSGQCCELREVVLKNKPPEMLAVSPQALKATVPVLVLPGGQVIAQIPQPPRQPARRRRAGLCAEPPKQRIKLADGTGNPAS